jgi:hypothetical protein
MKGLNVNIKEYIEVLKIVASNHAIGKLFTQYNNVNLDEKIYLILSAFFYLFSIYQNMLSCYRFHKNMIQIHNYLTEVKEYVDDSKREMEHLLSYTSKLSTYTSFNIELERNIGIFSEMQHNINRISPYKLSIGKMRELGTVLKCFYELHSSVTYNGAMLFSFGCNGFIDSIKGMIKNIQERHIQYANVVTSKKAMSNQKKCVFKKSYYPTLMNQNPVKNTFTFDKNMIITGPNASGKTTILKTALINILLTQQFGCGFYENATLIPFHHIHCYLNIPDTSGRDSLFQSETRKCSDIIKIVEKYPKENHFCVFDELYSGTNHEEATKCGHAFLLYLSKLKSVDFLLTTHYLNICKGLDKNNRIQNYKMDVQKNADDTLQYLYKIKKGISDVNGGVEILKQMNYPSEIMKTISEYNL